MIESFLIIFAIIQLIRNRIAPVIAIILCFFESYSFSGESISNLLFEHNYSDVGLFLMLLLLINLISRRKNTHDSPLKGLQKNLIIFFSFYFLLVIIDLLFNNIHFSSEIRMLRQWTCLILIWFVKYIKPVEVKNLLYYLLFISVGISLVFIFEYFTNSDITGAIRSLNKTRASVPWILSLLVFCLLLNNFYSINSFLKWTFIAIIGVEVLFTASRSLFIAYSLSAIIILFLFDSKINLKKFLYVALIAGGIVFLFSSDNVLTRRFLGAQQEVSNLGSSNAKVSGNFSFRVLLLNERIEYINKNLQYAVFGIGNVQEKDFHNKVFKIGMRKGNRHRGDIVQLDTSDIAWAVLILRLGYLGTFIYIGLFYIKTIWHYRKYRNQKGSFATAVYLAINLLVVSITYSYITNSFFWVLPILMLRLTLNEKARIKKVKDESSLQLERQNVSHSKLISI